MQAFRASTRDATVRRTARAVGVAGAVLALLLLAAPGGAAPIRGLESLPDHAVGPLGKAGVGSGIELAGEIRNASWNAHASRGALRSVAAANRGHRGEATKGFPGGPVVRIEERPPFGRLSGGGPDAGGTPAPGPSTPEPGAALLFAAGAGAIALRLRRL